MNGSDPPTAPPGAVSEPRRPRVLVCDESAAQREGMRSILGHACELCLTASAAEAIAAAPGFAPDVVLSELALPDMPARALCERLRAEPGTRDVAFVVVTSPAGADARAQGLEAGADDYLAKPVPPRELLARVGSLARVRRERRTLEERCAALERANAALRRAQEARLHAEKLATVGRLAAGLSHEINNPLSCIKSGAAALDELLDHIHRAVDRLPPCGCRARAEVARALDEARSVARELAAGSRRMESIATDLRVFALPERMTEEPVDLADAVDAVWAVARSRSAGAPRLAFADGRCAPIRTSGPLVRQALLAVLENAVQAAGPGGVVSVRIREIPDGAEIEVRDSGPGIPRELLPRVFDPYFTSRRAGAGTGLGLAVAYGIVSGLGGDIAVESPPGEGAVFRMRLPRAPGAFARGV